MSGTVSQEQLRYCEVLWEGSWRQNSGLRNTKRIGGESLVGEEAKRSKAQYHPDQRFVDATGIWSEGHALYPGRSAGLPAWARVAERRSEGPVEVSRGHRTPSVGGERTKQEVSVGAHAFEI